MKPSFLILLRIINKLWKISLAQALDSETFMVLNNFNNNAMHVTN